MIATLKAANLTLAFLLELGVLAALAIWGFHVVPGTFGAMALGVGAPLIATGVWATFGAPKSTRRLHGLGLLALRVVFLGSGAVALWAARHPTLGVLFAVISAINLTLLYVWKQ